MQGGADADRVYGGAGNDTLDGGTGNDWISGDAGSDTYTFTRGWGQDTVNNYDTSTGKIDAIRFASGIAASDIKATRSGTDLILSLVGSTDRITVTSYFSADATSNYRLEEIRFADGTAWSIDAVKALVTQGTTGADNLYGYATADTIDGQDGNDVIYGYAGADTLQAGAGADYVYGGDDADRIDGGAGADYVYGDAGDDSVQGGADADRVYGGAGNDTLDGGTGNDSLNGGAGNDSYRFSRGDGQDTITDSDATAGNTDALTFGSDVTADQLWFRQNGSNLEVSVIGTSDRLTISGWFSSNSNHVEQFRTSDGKVLLDSQVANLVSAMASFPPPAAGQTQLSPSYQNSLQPVIAANWHTS